ncbi:MAG TPA: hypothetical protein VJP81_00390 [Candidatus Dormibacteraeota bacterium]|nr:hypothetical protein [Candidatus Dormibacteraeota bacterium]
MGVRCKPDGEGWVCEVMVDQGGGHTVHTVTVIASDLDRWAGGRGQEEAEELVVRSFDFLLQREPPTSIMRRFNLSVIQSYFPEYDRHFKR